MKTTNERCTSRAAAWTRADALIPGDYTLDTLSSSRAGYPVHRSTLDRRAYICDLTDRLEVNLPDGSSVNLWIDPAAKTYSVAVKYYTMDGAMHGAELELEAGSAEAAMREAEAVFLRDRDVLEAEAVRAEEVPEKADSPENDAAPEESPAAAISAALADLSPLSARVTVYVPATNGTADVADNSREVDAVASALSTWFGGATIQPGSGCWMSETCGLVKEDTTTIYAACTAEHLAEKIGDVLELCRNLKVEMKQEAIALQLDGVPGSSGLYFI